MSDPAKDAAITRAANVRAQATEWLVEREEPDSWTAKKQAELDAWLAESPAHLLAFWRAENSWNRAGLISEFRPFAPRPEPQRRVIWSALLKGAAVFAAIAAVGAGLAFNFHGSDEESYATPVGGQKTIVLTDGSRIELNTDTVVNVSVGQNRRAVKLIRGEAYFRIKHDAQHPFVVAAAGHRIVDLGTEFLVRDRKGRLEVALVEGSARVEQADARANGGSALMTPGDVVVATANTLSITKKPVRELEAALSWRQGLLVFKHTTLAQAADEFNRYNRQRLVIADPITAHLKIRGTFRATDVSSFARLTSAVLSLHVENRGGEIVLSH